jgi:hypothetical protein
LQAEVWVKVFLSPNSKINLSNLRDNSSQLGVKAKEKPYGIVIKGTEKQVHIAIQELRKLDPATVFIRESAPPLQGKRIFQGFLQLSGEYSILPLISDALKCNTSEASRGETETSIKESRLVRCRYVYQYLGHVEAAVFRLENGEVLVRCFDGEGKCGWYNCTTCPYGTLIEKRNRKFK